MSFLGGGASKPRVPPPAPMPVDIGAGRMVEQERAKRSRSKSTLLSRGLLSEEPELFTPRGKTLLGQ